MCHVDVRRWGNTALQEAMRCNQDPAIQFLKKYSSLWSNTNNSLVYSFRFDIYIQDTSIYGLYLEWRGGYTEQNIGCILLATVPDNHSLLIENYWKTETLFSHEILQQHVFTDSTLKRSEWIYSNTMLSYVCCSCWVNNWMQLNCIFRTRIFS